jgi:sugar phosphate isomerase/epimerase
MIAILCMLPFTDVAAQRIGMQMGSLRELSREDPELAYAKMKELGIREAEGGIRSGTDLVAYKKQLKKYKIKLIATGASFDRLENEDSLKVIIKNAKSMNTQYIICYWIPHDGDNFTFENAKRGVEVFNAAGKTLRENGLTLSYHAHGYEFQPYEGEGTLFNYLMDHTNPAYVSFQMDVFWIKNPGQDPVALLKQYPDRWKSLHLKDRRIGTANNLNGRQDKETNVVLGTGDVGIEAVVKTARELGIKHYFIEDESSRALEQVPKSIAYLRSIGLE